MEGQRSFEMKPWMWVCLFAGLLCLVFNSDPIGEGFRKLFGPGADRWVINGIIIFALIGTILSLKRKK